MAVLALLSACWLTDAEVSVKLLADGTSDNGDEFDTDGSSDAAPCEITGLSPSYGTTAGGVLVEIQVVDTGKTPKVWFGDEEAEVVSLFEGGVEVRTPEVDEPGAVSVALESAEFACDLPDAFAYWQDGEGRYGALGHVYWQNYQGSYWGEDVLPYGGGWFAFTDPTDVSFADQYGGTLDQCESQKPGSFEGVAWIDVGGTATLVGTADPVELHWSDDDLLWNTSFDAGDLALQSAYQLEPIAGAEPEWPTFGVASFLRTPASFAITSPYVDGSQPSVLSGSNLALTWDASHPGDYLVIEVHRVVADATVETVRCVASDDGSFTVSGTVWDDWEFWDQYLYFQLGRVRTSPAELPHNRSTSGVVGVYWTAGAIWTFLG